jgi:hypothetical protein
MRQFLANDPRYQPWYDEFVTKPNGGHPDLSTPAQGGDYDYERASFAPSTARAARLTLLPPRAARWRPPPPPKNTPPPRLSTLT